jgi:transcriptional regulator of arginine metabolism
MTSTEDRRAAIRELIAQGRLHSQAELRYALQRRGYTASQPVLSRDLRALKVAKQSGIYQIVEEERVTSLPTLKTMVRSADPAGHFVLVHCEPGAASAVARALEAEQPPGLVGTVAGDDTVLVAVASQAAGRRIRQRVRELL